MATPCTKRGPVASTTSPLAEHRAMMNRPRDRLMRGLALAVLGAALVLIGALIWRVLTLP